MISSQRLFVSIRTWLCVAISLAFAVFHAAAADPAAENFEAANRLYDQGKFREAAQSYQALIESGSASPAVLFNLGNALFKSGQIGRAIAVYRMVQLRTPRDPDLQANLKFALGRVQGSRATEPRVLRWLQNFTLNELTVAACVCAWIFLLLIAVRQVPRWRGKFGRGSLLITGSLTLILAACLMLAVYGIKGRPKAIVVVAEAEVHQGPLDEAPTVFRVQDGAELRIRDRANDWLFIGVDGGRQGWIKRAEVAARN